MLIAVRTRVVAAVGALALAASLLVVLPVSPAGAQQSPPVATFDYTENIEPLGFSPRPNPSSGIYNSDLAFWGDIAYQGTYDGFQVIDISDPASPQKLLDYRDCNGTSSSNQGDVIAYENLLVRSWNSTAGANAQPCGGQPVPQGFRGIHIFDVSTPTSPQLITSVNPGCVSHTATGVPDPENNRLLVYNNPSGTGTRQGGGSCGGFDIIEIPLDDPASAATIGHAAPSPNRSCHDTAVIRGDANLALCAGGNGWAVFSLGGERGGSLEEPVQIASRAISGVSIGHTAAFSYDGRHMVFGHEPGGGSQARCQATSATIDKTVFFYETSTFEEVGRWVLPRPQAASENCTIHNFNVVPSTRRNILVSGNYQAGISVVDFTDPTNPYEFAYADPAPLQPQQLGGDWSSYWYNGHIYESDITRGLITWRLNDDRVRGAIDLPFNNPQTTEFTTEPVHADLSLSGAAANGAATVGETVGHTVTATNHGPEAAEDVRVLVELPDTLAFEAEGSDERCAAEGLGLVGVTCHLGDLDDGESVSADVRFTVLGEGIARATATVTSDMMDENQSNNEAALITIVNAFSTQLDPEFELDGETATVSGSVEFPAITSRLSVGGTKTGFSAQAQPAAELAAVDLHDALIQPIQGGLRFTFQVDEILHEQPPGMTVDLTPPDTRLAWTVQVEGSVYQLEVKRTRTPGLNAGDDPAGLVGSLADDPLERSFRLKGDCSASYQDLPVSECRYLTDLSGTIDHDNGRVSIDWPFETRDAGGQVVAPEFKPGAVLTHCGACSTTEGMSIFGSLQSVTVNNPNVTGSINGWDPWHVGERVQLAAGPAGADPRTLAYGSAVALTDGAFSGQVSGVSDTNNVVFARACTATLCAYSTLRVL